MFNAALLFEFVLGFDAFIARSIIDIFPRSPYLQLFFAFLSLQGLTVIIWILALIFWISWEEYNHHKFILYFLLSFGISTFFVEVILKNIVQRLRPWVVWHLMQNGCPASFSFPSGHAAGAFAGAVIFAHFDPKRKYWYYLLASLIAFSRIYLYCHFFLDVVAGGLIGYAIGRILLVSLQKKKLDHHS